MNKLLDHEKCENNLLLTKFMVNNCNDQPPPIITKFKISKFNITFKATIIRHYEKSSKYKNSTQNIY